MQKKYLLEGHKLHWHLDRVLAWSKGEWIVPIHIDAGLSKGSIYVATTALELCNTMNLKKGPIIIFPESLFCAI